MQEQIIKAINEYSINIDSKTIVNLSNFASEVIDKNKKINLISASDEKNIIDRHIIDCAIISKSGLIKKNEYKTLLDVGSGAGFPGIVISILFKEIKVTLSESKNKKYLFLLWIKEKLKLSNLQIINERIEKTHKIRYDIVTQRAAGKFEYIYPIACSILNNAGSFISWMGYSDIVKIKDDKKPDFIYNYYLKDGIKRSLALWRNSFL